MSIKLMNLVFERYPVGGNEGMLALALADHAHDDGTRIYPALDTLAHKTKQSRSSVRRHVRVMQLRGWLVLVQASDGRGGRPNEYRINPDWIAGKFELPEAVPADPGEGVNLEPSPHGEEVVESPVDNREGWVSKTTGEGVTAVVGEGVTAVVPESSGTIREPSRTPPPPVATGGSVQNPEQPKPEASRRERMRWRWADSRSEIEGRGQQLGVGRWDEAGYGTRHRELFPQYAARVFIAHLAEVGVAVSQPAMLRALSSNSNWSEVVRSMAAAAQDNDNPRSSTT